uniref:Pyrin domain-containing protein n=1 Tax=Stegastes partitus TaxID=144197 RepID=A0A3B5A3X2_9TELE
SRLSSDQRLGELLQELQELKEVELWRLHWCLLNLRSDPIPASRLEAADRTRTVDLMVQQYHAEGAVEVTEEILRKLNYNQLAEELLS